MSFSHFYQRLGFSGGWSQELWLAAIALGVGFGLMPVFIYLLGSSLLGRYDGASLHAMFESIYLGLRSGSAASWIVLFGPYALHLIFRALQLLWCAGGRLA
jgi:hypothetical protein